MRFDHSTACTSWPRAFRHDGRIRGIGLCLSAGATYVATPPPSSPGPCAFRSWDGWCETRNLARLTGGVLCSTSLVREPRSSGNNGRTDGGPQRSTRQTRRSPSPPPYRRGKREGGSSSTGSSTPSSSSSGKTKSFREDEVALCTVCLAYHKGFRRCTKETLWSGRPAHSTRASDGHLITKAGRNLCTDFQRTGTCSYRGSKHVHECSGCGDKSHGALQCPLAQKN